MKSGLNVKSAKDGSLVEGVKAEGLDENMELASRLFKKR